MINIKELFVMKDLSEMIYAVNVYSSKSRFSRLLQILLKTNDIEKVKKVCEE